MYRILVCFKIAEDYDQAGLSVWDTQGALPQTDHLRRMPGCFDEAALEQGLIQKDRLLQKGEEVRLTALSVNPGYSDHILNRLYAVGYDEVVCLQVAARLDFQPECTAEAISRFLRGEEAGYDQILCGEQAPPGNSGLVPYWLEAKIGRQIHIAGTKDAAYLRIPTLRDKMKCRDKKPRIVEISAADMPDEMEWLSFESRHRMRDGIRLDAGDLNTVAAKCLAAIREQDAEDSI